MFNVESLLSGMYCTRAAKVNRQMCYSHVNSRGLAIKKELGG